MNIDLNSTATQQAIAEFLDMTRQAVSLIEQRGVCRRDMPVGEWVRAYLAHLREVAAGRLPADGDIDLVTERALLARRQRERIERQMKLEAGELLQVQDVLDSWAMHIGAAKTALLGLPAKAAGLVAPAGKQAEAEAILRREIRQILTELATNNGAPKP